MAVRKVQNHGKNIIGRFPSVKLGRSVEFESLIERDYIYLLDFDTAVTWFAEQPFTIEYQHEGKKLTYTPDFHVIRDGQQIVVECKPAKYVNSAINQRKFQAARAWCEAKGWHFEVATDAEIRGGHRLTNVRRLTQFARYSIPPQTKEQICFYLSQKSEAIIADVMNHIANDNPQSVIIPILNMAFHHELIIPLDEAPITPTTSVKLP